MNCRESGEWSAAICYYPPMRVLEAVNSLLWHDAVLFCVLGVGILFTLWTRFGQFMALTHGVSVIRGNYDHPDHPGAINHFQALSAALSATVGLGNIAGVAIAISVGGPGAVLWMWVIGFVGMALKMTEVTQAMLYRDVSDPDNPHGGAMWVASRGLPWLHPSLAAPGRVVGVIFCLTLLVSTWTGGNMFQAWNVADITFSYFHVPKLVTGAVMTFLVGLVIIGGIKRIGAVADKLVPFMCIIYLVGALIVIGRNLNVLDDALLLIVRSGIPHWLGGDSAAPSGAFLGGVAGFAFLKGMQRALFSNEVGQGSAPIAHSAARTDEPVREGIVAGLEPFIDTLCVCTLTALVIILSGVWSREPELRFTRPPEIVQAGSGLWSLSPVPVDGAGGLPAGQTVFAVIAGEHNAQTGSDRRRLAGTLLRGADGAIAWETVDGAQKPTLAVDGVFIEHKGATLTAKAFDQSLSGLGRLIVPLAAWLFALSTMISWSYYGEQGVVYLFGERWVQTYRISYCLLILASTSPLIATEYQLDVVSSLGTGVMLIVNIPLMLIFGPQAMRAYHTYRRRLRAGEFARR